MLVTGPSTSLPKRMPVATPVSAVKSAVPEIAVTMPSLRSSRLRTVPSSSVTVAVVSSKRTPATMIEPKPEIGPTLTVLEIVPVPPVPTPAMSPPPPPPHGQQHRQARSKRQTDGQTMQQCSHFSDSSCFWGGRMSAA
jgi:hypothetical protein